MSDTNFLRLALPTPLRRVFDYLPPQEVDLAGLTPGMRVRVPFQNRELIGVLIEVVKKSDVPYGKLKRALEIIDSESVFAPDIYQLCEWAAGYYHYSLGEVFSAALPVLLRKGAAMAAENAPLISAKESHQASHSEGAILVLNADQAQAVEAIIAAKTSFKTFLLDGVTGSGKTEVYLRAIDHYLKDDKQVLILVPEISLTPQTIERFRSRFPVPIVALHSNLSDKERLHAWRTAREGTAKIVIGTRSAIFTPFKNLGLMIVDEEHDQSFKQQDHFRYHARDLVVMRASFNQIPVVLGSATPSLESLLNAKRDRYQHLILKVRAGEAVMPSYHLIDLRQSMPDEGLSPPLLQAMRDELNAGNQVMLFLNRRGFAPVLYCSECAHIIECKRCDARMVYHNKPPRLQCHHCDAKSAIPTRCVKCKGGTLTPVGLGTQRIEETLKNYFPEVPVIRVDRDSTRKKNALHELLNEIHAQPTAILLGTQMLAKGHHFPNVTLVGVIDADSGLFSADFRAIEQMGQLLVQVSGRAGRAEKNGRVLIQTRHPDHPLLQVLLSQGYAAFANQLLTEREMGLLPPYSYFAVLRAEGYKQEIVSQFLEGIKEAGHPIANHVTLLGPVQALLARRKGLYCQQLLVKANKRGALQQFLKNLLTHIEQLPSAKTVKWVLDVDPVEVG